MNEYILYLSFIPAILWILFFYHQDKYEKEPIKLVAITFLAGCLSVIPALVVELVLEKAITFNLPFSPFRILVMMIMVGFTEEICKFIAVKKAAYDTPDFNEPMDGIVYSVTAAMGFAFVENIMYMLKFRATSGLLGAYSIGVLRALYSMFAHATFGVIMGSYLGRAKFEKDKTISLFVKGIVLAALVHTLFNFTLAINNNALGVFLLFIAFPLVWRNMNRAWIGGAHDTSPFKPENEKEHIKHKWRWGFANILSIFLITVVIFMGVWYFNHPLTYIDETKGYQLQHPSTWQVVSNKHADVVEFQGPPFQGSLPVLRIETYPAGEPLSSMVATQDLLYQLDGKYRNFKQLESKTVGLPMGEISLAKVEWTEEINHSTQEKTALVTAFQYRGKEYNIIGTSNTNLFGRYEHNFLEIIDSFVFY